MHLDSKGCCKNPRIHAEGHLSYYNFLKSPIFNSQRLALHQNGVEFRQQFTGAISLSASQEGVRRRPLSIVQSELFFFYFNHSLI